VRTIADHILDIASNSIAAGASDVWLDIASDPEAHMFTFMVRDNGRGMDDDLQKQVFDPFITTRPHTIRRFGLGLPLLRQNTELTGGTVGLQSHPGVGTTVSAVFHTDHIDCIPTGDIAGALFALLTCGSPVRWHISRREGRNRYTLTTEDLEGVFPSGELSDPRAQQLVLRFLQEREADLVADASRRDDGSSTT
jgi:hypothetical protein